MQEFDIMNQLILEIDNVLEILLRFKIDINVQKSILKFVEEVMAQGSLEDREDYDHIRLVLEEFYPRLIHQIDLKLRKPEEVGEVR